MTLRPTLRCTDNARNHAMNIHIITNSLVAAVSAGATAVGSASTLSAAPAAETVPADQPQACILGESVVCHDGYCGWPTVCRRKTGELLVVYSGDRTTHVDPWGKVRLVRSSDDGKSWSKPVTLCNTLLDDRDAGILETRDGALVVNWFNSTAWRTWYGGPTPGSAEARHTSKLPGSLCEQERGNFTIRSVDGGKTWGERATTDGSAPHGGIELKDGRLLMVGKRANDRDPALLVEESRDAGKTWHVISHIVPSATEAIANFCEPHVVEVSSGRLLAMIRYQDKSGLTNAVMRQCESRDGGKTWSTPRPSGIVGFPPHLQKLTDGRLLVVYCRRLPPAYGQYACLSKDGGRTWDTTHEIELARGFDIDNGYPSTIQLPDETLLTIYYGAEKRGESPCLRATRWKVKP